MTNVGVVELYPVEVVLNVMDVLVDSIVVDMEVMAVLFSCSW